MLLVFALKRNFWKRKMKPIFLNLLNSFLRSKIKLLIFWSKIHLCTIFASVIHFIFSFLNLIILRGFHSEGDYCLPFTSSTLPFRSFFLKSILKKSWKLSLFFRAETLVLLRVRYFGAPRKGERERGWLSSIPKKCMWKERVEGKKRRKK